MRDWGDDRGDRGGRFSDRQGPDRFGRDDAGDRGGDRRPFGGSSGGGGGRFGRDGDGGDRGDVRGFDGGRGNDRDGGRGGYDRDNGRGYDRDSGNRMGGDRDRGMGGDRGSGDRFEGRGGRRGGDLPTDEELGKGAAERPAHLRKLLKKDGEEGEEEAAQVEGGKRETALERMEREAAEREKAATEASRPQPERREPAAERGPIPVDDRPRRFGQGRAPGAEGGVPGGPLPSASTGDGEASNKVPELAPIRLSSLRKAGGEGVGARTGQAPTSAAAPAPAVLAAPVPTPVSVMDDSRYAEELKKPLAAAKKLTALEKAVKDKEGVTEKQLVDGLQAVDLDDGQRRVDVGGVVARSLVEGKLTLETAVKVVKDGRVLTEALKAYKDKKSEEALLRLVRDSGVQVLPVILPSPAASATEVEAFLTQQGLLVLKPIPDLTTDITALLSSSAPPAQVVDALNAGLAPSTPIPALTKLVTGHVFGLLFTPTATAPSKAMAEYIPLLTRVANDGHARVLTLYAAQAAWFKAGCVKGALKDVFVGLKAAGVVKGVDVVGWRDDLKEGKGVAGKPKALLQVSLWVKEVEEEVKKERPREEEEDDEDEEDEDEDEDEDESYPSRR